MLLSDRSKNKSIILRAGWELPVALIQRNHRPMVHPSYACVEAGLVSGNKIHVDASLVDANASLRSVKPLEAEVVSAI